MDVQLLVTKTDFCIANLETQFKNLGVDYHLDYIEDRPDLVAYHHIRHSPNVLVEGRLVFRQRPSPDELRTYFQD